MCEEIMRTNFRYLVYKHCCICEEGELVLTKSELIFECPEKTISHHLDRVVCVEPKDMSLTIHLEWQPEGKRKRQQIYSLMVKNPDGCANTIRIACEKYKKGRS